MTPQATPREYETGSVPIEYSGWVPASHAIPTYDPLQSDIDTDVVVIGAGLTGASAALHLAERKLNVVVLEAHQPAWGASGRNAGIVLPFLLGSLDQPRSWPDQGRRFVDTFVANRNIVFAICARHGIEGDAEQSGFLQLARRPSAKAALEREARPWKRFGYDVELVGADGLRELTGSDVYRIGLRWRDGGRVNPFLFTNGMITAASRLGCRVFGRSAVTACEKSGERWLVRTANGSVRTQKVVLCTNGHRNNTFFPELAATNYPLVACGLATKPLSEALLKQINPSGIALEQFPNALFPLVIDGRKRLLTGTIPWPWQAQKATLYMSYFRRYLRRTYPQVDLGEIELDSYWTGMTESASSKYHHDYPKMYDLAPGVTALANLGTWGNVLGPLMGMNFAQALANERPDDLMFPVEHPCAVKSPQMFEWKIRYLLIPLARVADRLGLL